MGSIWPLVIISLFASLACGVPLSSFYPHGSDVQDSILLSTQEAQVPEVTLKVPIKFYDESYSSIYVNEYGCLTFRASLPQFISIPFPLDYPTIAALYSNVDIHNGGRIYYRETNDQQLLQRADEDVASSFPNYVGRFSAKSLFIATWIDVGYNVARAEKVNTFQIVVISDGDESFVEFLYADNGIQWIQGVPTDQSGFPDAKAQAGLMQDNNLYTLPNSGTDQVYNLDKISNTETPGRWIFRVGVLVAGGIDTPHPHTQVARDATCAVARPTCHSNAECTDDSTGYCCVCKSGYYGNGVNCLLEGKPIRINGKFSLDVNGVTARNIDLQSYVATADGRHYTVLTKLPPVIGHSLQLANSLANGVGWLFAKSVSAPNGYQISGGVFNYSAELMFATGQRLSIQQEFTGHDVFDQLTVTGSIRGSIPVVVPGIRLQVEDLQQEYTRSAPGLFQSQSSLTYQLPGNNPPQISLRLVQTIQYSEGCVGQAKNITNSKMKLAKNMIVYEARENNLRVASTNKISSMNLNDDPCRNFFCVANSSCVVEDDRPTCLCNKGFQQLYSEDRRQEDFGCFDINECNEGRDTCHQNAICFNEIGSFSCQCRPGYTGNGHDCTEITAPQTPAPSPCELDPHACNPPNSSCTDPSDYRTCNCNPGFQKDYLDDRHIGFVCIDIDECLNYPYPCNHNADCINQPGSFHCECREGYSCDETGSENHLKNPSPCESDPQACNPPNSSCIDPSDYRTCNCNPGFQKDYLDDRNIGFVCIDINECLNHPYPCHRNADCTNQPNQPGSFHCECREGYSCDETGSENHLKNPSPCESDPQACNPPNSSCTDPSDYRTCNCNPGFQKDYLDDRHIGFVCIDINECLNHPYPCNRNADCTNQPGSFHCECREGYSCDETVSENQTGPQHHLYPGGPSDMASVTCDNVRCQENAECIEDPTTGPHCNCVQGFVSNGKTCVAYDKMTCDFAQDCGSNAQCILNEAVSFHVCICDDGYLGDGYTCIPDDPTKNNGNKVAKICIFNDCECPKGYVENGLTCVKQEAESPPTSPNGVPCNTKTSCHPNAQCVYMSHARQYLCQCNAGYDGDGANCAPVEESCFQVDNCHHQASCHYQSGQSGRASCVCDAGYTGDGISNCDPIVSTSSYTIPCSERDEPLERKKEDGNVERYFESNSSTQCGPNAYCTDNVDTKQLECVCHDGFYRDGDACRSEKGDDTDEDCETPCHTNAQCIIDDSNELKEQARCKCNVGYTGDGVHECNAESLGCNVVKNCHANAECVYNATSAGYRCQCSQGYVGNGVECHPIKTCMEDRSLCAKDASCVTGTQGHFHCECNEGFTGNGFMCKPVHKKESDFLLVNQGMAMMRIPYQTTRTDMGRPIHMHPNQMLIGIAVDCVEGLVYYSTIADKSSIKRSYFDGKNVEDAITTNIGSPEGITIDWLNRVLYWTDSKYKTIAMAQLSGSRPSQPQVIVKSGLVNPRGIAVHPYYQKVFWSDWNKQSPKIEWSNLDGTNREIFLQGSDLKLPNSLAVDFSRDELCWVDAGAKSLECASIRTRERRKVFPNCTYPFGLSITDDKYYWTDWGTYRVESASKTGEKSSSIALTLMGTTLPYGIAAVPNRCPGT